MVAIRAHSLLDASSLIDYVRHYLAFIERCQRPDGRFRNFMAGNGAWLEELGSGDSHGRAVWALGFACERTRQTEVRLRALRCLDGALPHLGELPALRSKAFALLGLRRWSRVEPSKKLAELEERFISELASAFRAQAAPDWRWFEDRVTYSNSRLPEALIGTAESPIGLESLAWLCRQMEAGGVMSLIGSQGFYPRGGHRAVYDQQAVCAAATVSACLAAAADSGDARFRRWAEMAFGWFTGANVGGRSMIDQETGGCYDGLCEDGVNLNQGAESLLAWLLAQEDMMEAGLIPV
ncbi:MAG: hypothetical protein KGJ86_02530 [Chloroflexota bacterium]|nr:hypothetical protein [Chloroflexota bacterium]